MLAKLTDKNQITLPEAVVRCFEGVESFDVSTDGVSIVLRPVGQGGTDEVRRRLADRGIEEQDVAGALGWSRDTPSSS